MTELTDTPLVREAIAASDLDHEMVDGATEVLIEAHAASTFHDVLSMAVRDSFARDMATTVDLRTGARVIDTDGLTARAQTVAVRAAVRAFDGHLAYRFIIRDTERGFRWEYRVNPGTVDYSTFYDMVAGVRRDVVTFADDRGTRITLPMDGLTVYPVDSIYT